MKKLPSWLNIRMGPKPTSPVEILIYGPIGGSWFDDSGFTDEDIVAALKDVPAGTPIKARINSEGGSVWDGLAIYNALKRRQADVTAIVDGVALSIASFIPLAAAKVVSPRESIWMIHDPWTMTVGDSDEHRRTAEMLDTHARAIVSGYQSKTGKSEVEIRKAMRAETWMRGDEAMDFGLVDLLTEDDADVPAVDTSAFAKVPPWAQAIFNQRKQGGHQQRRMAIAAGPRTRTPAGDGGEHQEDKMDRTKILALLKKHGVDVADDVNDETLLAELNKLVEAGKVKQAQADKLVPQPIVSAEEFAAMRQRVEAAERRAIEAEHRDLDNRLRALCATRPSLEFNDYREAVHANPKLLDTLAKIPTVEDRALPRGIVTLNEGIMDAALKMTPKERVGTRNNPGLLIREYAKFQELEAAGKFRSPHAANTDSTSGALVPAIVADIVITNAQNRLAPLRAFNRLFSTDRIKANSVIQIPRVTAGGTAQTDATNFEDTTNFVGTLNNAAITPAQYTSGGHITMDEFRNGYRLQWWTDIKIAELSDALMAAVAALITTTNFSTHTALTSAVASFGGSEMRQLWGTLKKAPMKYLVIDGEALANLLPATREDWDGVSANYPGWAGIYLNTVWTGATTNTYAFACHPNALAVGAGLPVLSPNASRSGLQETVITLPDLGLSVAMNTWFALPGRVDWMTLDVMFGAQVVDTTLGVLVKSA